MEGDANKKRKTEEEEVLSTVDDINRRLEVMEQERVKCQEHILVLEKRFEECKKVAYEWKQQATGGPILMIMWGNDSICNEFYAVTQKEAELKASGLDMTIGELLRSVDGKCDEDDKTKFGETPDTVCKFRDWLQTNQAKALCKPAKSEMPQRPSAVLKFFPTA